LCEIITYGEKLSQEKGSWEESGSYNGTSPLPDSDSKAAESFAVKEITGFVENTDLERG
jgi:hypothetical protein